MRPAHALLLPLALACRDSAGPSDHVTIYVCPNIAWVGVQVGDGVMQTIPPGGRAFRRTDRVIAARLWAGGSAPLSLYYMTAGQLAAAIECPPAMRHVNGSVVPSSVAGGLVTISSTGSTASAGENFPGFVLQLPPAEPFDLMANVWPGFKTIIRRGQVFDDGATMPPLDFTSQAFVPEARTVTVTGASAQQLFGAVTYLVTKGGVTGVLGGTQGTVTGPDVAIYTVPSAQLADGDLHMVQVTTETLRGLNLFTRTPAGRSVTFGPQANTATLASGTVSLVSQSEYGAYVSMVICRPSPSPSPVSATITATREYFGGTPTTWSLPLPDFHDVQGFPGHPDMRDWKPCQVQVFGYPYGFRARDAREGDTYKFAARGQ